MVRFSVMITGMYSMGAVATIAKQIEEYGFDEFHIADDLVFRPAWPMLTVAAQATTRIKLGPFIVTPQVAHPVYHASNLAALDELSGGRAICGIGRGGFNALIGIDGPRRAIAMLKEAYIVMRRMLDDDRSAFEGEFFSATEGLYFEYDIARRSIPIYIGSWGPKMARMAGAIAPGLKVDCVANPVYLKHLATEMSAGANAAGRDPATLDLIAGPLCSVSRDGDRAKRTAKELLALLQPFLAPMTANEGLAPDRIERAAAAHRAGDVDRAVDFVTDKALKDFALAGTPKDIIPGIEALVDAGATSIAFGPPLGPDFNEALHLIATEVLPQFRRTR